MLAIESAEYVDGYRLRLTFNDSKAGIADLHRVLCDDPRPVFSALRERRGSFREFRVESDTVCWVNGPDIAPEYLYFLAFQDDPALRELFEKWGYSRERAVADR